MKTNISISKKVSFEAAHRLRLHEGECKSLHGHTYKVVVEAQQNPLATGVQRREETGMVADFGILSRAMEEVIFEGLEFFGNSKFAPSEGVPLDHSVILNVVDPLIDVLEGSSCSKDLNIYKLAFEPTAENMAVMLMNKIQVALGSHQRKDIRITKVSLWETETNFATVEAKDVQDK